MKLSDYKELLPVFGMVATLAAGWAVMEKSSAHAEETDKAQWTKLDNHETRISRIEEDVKLLPEIRQDIKTLLRASGEDD